MSKEKEKNLTKEEIKKIKEKYIKGKRIELIKMNDETTPVPPHTKGTVDFVDDLGTIFVRWDNGSRLGLIVGKDEFKIVEDINEILGFFNEEFDKKLDEEKDFIPILTDVFYNFILNKFKTTEIESEISKTMLQVQDELEKTLTKEQKDLFRRYDSIRDELDSYSAKHGFVYGFCFDKQLNTEKEKIKNHKV